MIQRLGPLALLLVLLVPGAAGAHEPGGGHPTSSTISCTPNPMVRGNSVSCLATVQDGSNPSQASSPQGTVSFTSSVAGAIGSCTLAPGAGFASSCSVSYTPAAAGTETITASYPITTAGGHRWAATSANQSLVINPAPPAALRVVQSPSGQPTNTVAGQPIQRAGGGGIQIEVLNTLGERITSGTGSSRAITMSIQTNAGGGTLSGTLTVNAVNGVATFNNLSINKAGIGYRLRATAAGVSGVNTTTFNITAAAAARLAFAQQPSNTVAGQAIGGGVGITVRVEDTFGNVVSTDNSTQVTVAILDNPGGGTLSGTAAATAVNGVATFTGLSIDKAGVEYRLQGSGGGYTAASSGTFDILAGPAAQLSFGEPPTNTTAGQVINDPGGVTVRVEDAFGNLIASSNAAITVALDANPGATVLQGTLTANAVSGVATFSNLVIAIAANGYTIAATTPGLVGTSSPAFNITPSAATKLSFGQPPTNNEAAQPISPAITVRVEDAGGNLVDDNRLVTLAFGANPGGGVLDGTLSVQAVNGVATFSDIEIDVAASGYTLVASAPGGLTDAVSAPFTIAPGAPTQLAFQQQPTDAAAGDIITPAVSVRILDSVGNLVPTAANAVTLSIGANPGPGSLSGTVTVNAVNGVATFNTLSINRAASGYTLVASAASLASATSTPFDISTNTPFRLRFAQQPSNTVAGMPISDLVGGITVRVEDASGNLVTTATTAVTLSIEFDAGGVNTPLLNAGPVNAVNGVATFPAATIQQAGTGYTLRASDATLQHHISASFNITHAGPDRLAFGTQPSNTTAGSTITPAVTVRVLDAYDNLVTSSSASVALAIAANPGSGVLGGNTTANAVNGVASFGTLFINAAGAGYTLAATSGSVTGATSNAFTISPGSANKLGFIVQPSNTELNAAISPPVQVAVQDALGNTITGSTAPVSIVLETNPGGTELSGTTTVNAVNGVASFSTLSLAQTGNGYTLAANSSGLASTVSTAFNVTIGPPAQLEFLQQPMNTAPNVVMTPWPSVRVLDAAGNPVPFSGDITVAKADPGGTCGGALSGTLTVAAVDGVATFSTLQVGATGTGCRLVASSGALDPSTSNSFSVLDPGFTFTGLSPALGPSTGGTLVTINGSGFGPQVGRYQVIFGTANPAPPVTAERISDGELEVSTPAHPPGLVNVIVVDTQTGGTRALQGVFEYVSSTPTKLAFGQQPTDIVAGEQFSPVVTVQVLDVNNNVVNNAAQMITISFHENLPGGALLGQTTVQAVNGVATFTNLSVDKVGTGYRLAASAPILDPPAPSNAFAVTAGSATKLAFSQQPTNNDPGVPISPAVTVQVHDQFDNLVTAGTHTIEMEIGTNAGAGTLSGGISVASINGVASFSALTIDKAGDGYTRVATTPGLTLAESASFNINFGQPARVAIDTHPGNGVAGEALAPALVARIEDSQGNLVEDSTAVVTISIANNVGGSTLTGTVSVNAVDGVATFSNAILDKVGLGYTLQVSSFGLESATTNPFDISNNVASGLVFETQPTDTSQGAVITPSVQVRVRDAFNNLVPDATNTVTMGIGVNPGGGVLGGTINRAAVGGIATFNDLTVSIGGSGYTLVATATGLDPAESVSFNVISVGGSLNIFSPLTPAGDIVGYLPTIVAGEDFCVDIVRINEAGTAPANYSNNTIRLQLLDASVNTGSLLPGNCRSSWTVIKEWEAIPASPGDGSRVNVCSATNVDTGQVENLYESNVWTNVRFRAFTTQGNQNIGCSNDAFSLRPDFYELATISVTDEDWQTAGQARSLILPGAPTDSGGPVHAAGRPFRIQVTAVNAQGEPTSNYSGTPEIEVIERLLPADCTGCPAPQVASTGWGSATGVTGAVRTNQARFHDAGSLTVRLVDKTFSAVDAVANEQLGIDPATTWVASDPINIGRFVPDSFVVTPLTDPVFWTQGDDHNDGAMTCGPRSFTYIGQPFGYQELPQAVVSARSANGAVTPAYRDELWNLSTDWVVQDYSYNTDPADAAVLDTSFAPLVAGNASLVSANDGTGTLTVNAADRLSFTRDPLAAVGEVVPEPPLPFDAFITLTLSVYDDAEAGTAGNARINTGTPGVFSNIEFDSGNKFRYGRMRLINSVGSELEDLTIPYRLQTWQDLGNNVMVWVTETGDNCSNFQAADFSVQNIQDTGLNALDPQLIDVTDPVAAGVGDLTFGAQEAQATGSFEVFGDGVPSWLWYNWTNSDTGAEEGPTAKAAFGVNEGNPRRIFRSQSFVPRPSGQN